MFDDNYLDNIYVHFKSNNDIYISTVPYDLPGDLYCHSLHYVISHFRSFI